MGSPRYRRSRVHKATRLSTGNLTLNSTNWADVNNAALDREIKEAQAGDAVVVGLSGRWGTEAVWGFLDIVTVVASTPLNSFCQQGPVVASPSGNVEGIPAWHGVSGGHTPISGYSMPYVLTAADVVDGVVTLRLRYATLTAANKTLYASTAIPLDLWAVNMGPGQS